MQDLAPPHCTDDALEFFEEKFPNHVISRRRQSCSPARSPDLSPFDFFFVWVYLDSKLAEKNPATIEDAKISWKKKSVMLLQKHCDEFAWTFEKGPENASRKKRDLFEADLYLIVKSSSNEKLLLFTQENKYNFYSKMFFFCILKDN